MQSLNENNTFRPVEVEPSDPSAVTASPPHRATTESSRDSTDSIAASTAGEPAHAPVEVPVAVAVGTRPPSPGRTRPSRTLDVFDNPNVQRDYLIQMQVPEFTCLCPLTGQPDFAFFTIDYVPDRSCVELKSLKLYFWSFRDEGSFHEAVTNRVLDDLVGAMAPRYLRVTARWGVRGGIFTNVVVEHRKPGWTPPPPVALPSFDSASPIR